MSYNNVNQYIKGAEPMTKDEILKVFYQQQIAQLVESCNDSDLLEIIYKLLNNKT